MDARVCRSLQPAGSRFSWIGFWRSIRRRLIRWNFSFLLSGMTLNHYLNDTFEKWCVRLGGGGVSFRMPASLALTPTLTLTVTDSPSQPTRANKLSSQKEGIPQWQQHKSNLIRVNDLIHHQHMSNFTHTIQDLHDILQPYYKVARKRFVDNIYRQATG